MARNKKGFTLIELLIVVVIIGILAAIAIPKFANTKEKAYLASMKADLRNLATYEESYAADSAGTYFSGNGSAQGFTRVAERDDDSDRSSRSAGWLVSGCVAHAHDQDLQSSVNGLITCT